MCGYDPLYWYEQELDREYLAYKHGYDSYEEYYNDLQDFKENQAYDERMGK